MKIMQRWVWTVSLVSGLFGWTAGAEVTALVKGNRVNVRSQASLRSEVITQVNEGDAVTILEEIDVENPRRGEPAKWSRIKLTDTPVWVYAPYVETTNYTVNVNRLNVRAGPGEHHSVLGRIVRGTPVKQIRVIENWMEIESPEAVSGFIASDLLEKTSEPEPVPPPDEPTPAVAVNPPTPTPATTETVPDNAPPSVATDPVAMTPPTEPSPPPATPSEPVVDTPPPIRIVSREGTVVYSRSIQSPTIFGIESAESLRIVNYLHSEDPEIKVEDYKGKKVIATGEELIDQRWHNTPILDVHSIELLR